jgi:hypothetical protein
MKPSSFIQGLIADITRSDVVEDAEMVKSRVSKYTMVAYAQAAAFSKNHKAKSPEITRLDDAIDMGLNDKLASAGVLRKGGSIIENIDRVLPQMLKNIEVVAELIEKHWNEKTATSSLTYRNANLLQFVSLGTFVDRFARAYLNYYFIRETATVNPKTDGFANMNKAEISWLAENATSFGAALSIVAVKTEKLIALIEIMPDLTISREHSESAEAVIGVEKVDPLQMSFIPTWLNPIYAIRMRIVDWQTASYDEAKEDLKRLQLRKLFLEEAKGGKHDVRLENELTKVHEKISDLHYKVAQAEERVR